MLDFSQKIELMLHILNNLDQYIKYYNADTFMEDIQALGFTVNYDNPTYSYEAIEAYVLNKSIMIENRYIRENFLDWYNNGLKLRDERLNTPAKVEMVLRDIQVTKQEITVLYFFKNWELDKNVYEVSQRIKNKSVKGIKLDDILYSNAEYLSGLQRNTTVFFDDDFNQYDSLVKFKEEKDCEIIAGCVISTIDSILKGRLSTLVICTSKDNMGSKKDRPYMFLHYEFHFDKTDTIVGMINAAIDKDRGGDIIEEKYDLFYGNYSNILKKIISYSLYVSTNPKGDKEHCIHKNTKYRKADPRNIKNKYREIDVVSVV